MLDGLLLFSVLDVWRVLLPLSLSTICVGTLLFQRLVGQSQDTGLSQFLGILTYRLTSALAVISAVVGIVLPWVLDYPLPEPHVADGPWGYEEICGYLVGLALLWRMQQQVRQKQIPSGMIMTAAMVVFLGVALFWIARWDVMANEGAVQGGWFVGSSAQWEWSRLIPKFSHLLFSALIIGGMVVTFLGVFRAFALPFEQGRGDSESTWSSPSLIRYGVGWILSGLVPQMLIGPWLFLLLQHKPQVALIEGVSLTSIIFFVSVTAAFLALVLLNASFMAPHVKGLVWGGLANVAMTLVLMGIVRYETFVATLASQRIPFATAALTGWHVLSVFMLMGLFGVILMRWCVWPSALIYRATLPTSQLDKT